ncbi:MAG: iron-containing alcohol dehydrogenase, partial [Eubacterium sp.]|nr:iron-containing alcohol dehydrogenase [Eubacterium sp.]
MRDFEFENSTKVIFGRGCVRKHLPEFLSHYGKRVLLSYGGGSIKKNGIYDEVTEILTSSGKEITEFSGIMPNPTYAKVMEGAELAHNNNIDLILAVGGGSVMDCSKAVSLAARYNGDAWNDFWRHQGTVEYSALIPLL